MFKETIPVAKTIDEVPIEAAQQATVAESEASPESTLNAEASECKAVVMSPVAASAATSALDEPALGKLESAKTERLKSTQSEADEFAKSAGEVRLEIVVHKAAIIARKAVTVSEVDASVAVVGQQDV